MYDLRAAELAFTSDLADGLRSMTKGQLQMFRQ